MNPTQKNGIKRLHKELYKPLLMYALTSLGSLAMAEESVQAAFRKASSNPDEVLFSHDPKAWLLNAVRISILDVKSKHSRIATPSSGTPPQQKTTPTYGQHKRKEDAEICLNATLM